MAQIAEQEADLVIVTDDNPRTENPSTIFANIRAGFAQPEAIHFEHNRATAIRLAIQQAKSGDTVVIAGKGHETVQILADRSIPFDDRTQATLALQECAA
jgi:UDP-N-acetylmuramoyl-L-alanyl-D-glutamate--2,6-diaminopimelate ligase